MCALVYEITVMVGTAKAILGSSPRASAQVASKGTVGCSVCVVSASSLHKAAW